MLDPEEIKAILAPQFKHLGKSDGTPLWMHAFTVWSIASKITKFVPRFNDRERRLLEVAALIHDIGKMAGKNQEILSGSADGAVKHTQAREKIKAYFVDHDLWDNLELTEEDVDVIYHAHLHHNLPDNALLTAPPSMAVYADIIRYADWLASQDRLNRSLIQQLAETFELFCRITTVQISRPEGPANYLLFDAAFSIYQEFGWEALAVLPDGLLMIAPCNARFPEKERLINAYQERLVNKSLELQKPNPTNFAAVLLAGESAKKPCLYLKIHKEYLLEALGDFDRAPSFFFKLLIELLDLSGKLTAGMKETYPMLDILKGLCGTRGIPGARKKWQQMGGKNIEPLKEMLGEMFNSISASKFVPSEITGEESNDNMLKTYTSDRLYEILVIIAERLFPQVVDVDFKDEINSLVSMEEELDFRAIALARFECYKQYKKTQNPDKGICESCGSVMAFPTQKSLNFPGGKRWGFSQISAHTDSARATCTLCAFDTMMLRRDVLESKNPIYVRIESKTTDIWPLYGEIAKLILRLDEAFSYPYSLETLEKSNDFGFLPLPREFKLPKMREPKFEVQPFRSVRGYIIPIARVDNSASPKDLKAKYLALFALLNMMGFDAHIGFEEQTGLFGDKTIAKHGDNYESLYYRGLAIKWLANMLDKDNNAHVFAETLLTKSPSLAITKIGEVAANREKQKKIGPDQLPYIIEALLKGEFKIRTSTKGGSHNMKELLQDAAFFAEGIPAFVWSGDDHRAWVDNFSKHLITKPVSRAMNCILQGDDFEIALAKFLSLIKDDISGDKTREGSLAKVDVTDLKVFVEKSKMVIKRYFELRQADISSFIQAKNALLSAIYFMKRYPNVKEVVNG